MEEAGGEGGGLGRLGRLASADTAWLSLQGRGSLGCLDKAPPTERLNSRKSFSHSSGGWKPEVCLWAGLVSPEARSLAACPVVCPLCASVRR